MMSSSPKEPVIIDCVRTAVGRSHPTKGVFRDVRGDDLAEACIRAILTRTKIDPHEIEDVVFGCSKPTREQGTNVARLISLMAGLPFSTGGTTVTRLCGSGLQALNQASHAIAAGAEDVQIVGGLEHMHHLPLGKDVDLNPRLFHHTSKYALNMGLVAEHLANCAGIDRRQQDDFALQSHQRAAAAHACGDFLHEIVPVYGRDIHGTRQEIRLDQCVRSEATLDSLAALPPVFQADGTVTAGNSSPVNDGAAAMLVMSREKATALGMSPLATIRSTAVVGVEPSRMATAPVAAVHKALARAGLRLSDVELFEINEAFAVQAIACIDQLGVDPDRVNVRGGAIAIGHPLGASGIRIATTLTHVLKDRHLRFGVAAMCIGMGQGIATVLEAC